MRENKRKSVVHCFTGDKATLDKYLMMGFSIGITGWICDDRRAKELRDAVHIIPLDRVLIETDSPYLTPKNVPGLDILDFIGLAILASFLCKTSAAKLNRTYSLILSRHKFIEKASPSSDASSFPFMRLASSQAMVSPSPVEVSLRAGSAL